VLRVHVARAIATLERWLAIGERPSIIQTSLPSTYGAGSQ
jgi:hypothetical protein